jgi:hypothetical protein
MAICPCLEIGLLQVGAGWCSNASGDGGVLFAFVFAALQ